MSEYTVIGRSVPKVDALAKATGEARFATDVTSTGCCGPRSCEALFPTHVSFPLIRKEPKDSGVSRPS